jgi:TRAP-type C4-dicarboxylate transport system permease small subunit
MLKIIIEILVFIAAIFLAEMTYKAIIRAINKRSKALRLKAELLKFERLKKQGLKEFQIEGKTYYAINLKNAFRKHLSDKVNGQVN